MRVHLCSVSVHTKGQRTEKASYASERPSEIHSLCLFLSSPSSPSRECRSEHCSLAFAGSCTAMRSLCLLPLSHPLPSPSSPLPLSHSPPFSLSLLPSLSPSISTPPLNFQSHSSAEDIPPFSFFPPLPPFPIIHAEILAHIPSLPPTHRRLHPRIFLFLGHPTPTPFKMIPRYPCQAHPVVLLSFLPPLSVSSQCHCTLNLISPLLPLM